MLPSAFKHKKLPGMQVVLLLLLPSHHRRCPLSSWSKSSNKRLFLLFHRRRPPCVLVLPSVSSLAMQVPDAICLLVWLLGLGNVSGVSLQPCAIALPASRVQARPRNRNNLSFILRVLSVEFVFNDPWAGQVPLRSGLLGESECRG